jgi:putative ABC transport system permease protein
MARGRDFTADEDRPNGPKVAVISDGFWRRHFGGRPDVVGQTLQLDGEAYAIVGVTAVGLPLPGDIEVAVPMQADVAKENRLNHELDVFARLAPGVSIEAADRELQAISAHIATSMPAGERGWRTRLVPLVEDIVGDQLRRTLLVLLGAVGLLLLVACANLSNLLLVRATGRGFELAVRRALGESRGRAIAQRLVESLVVTALGGALGILLASWSVETLRTLPIPRMAEIGRPRHLRRPRLRRAAADPLEGVGPCCNVRRGPQAFRRSSTLAIISRCSRTSASYPSSEAYR